MGSIWIRELTGGLDTRRMPETTPGGALIVARNAHITRGGELEKRAAFVQAYALPANTIGLAADATSLYVFGSVSGVTTPAGVIYQNLAIDGYGDLVAVPSWDLFAGKLYVVAKYASGKTAHFYDGQRVQAWVDGYASVSFGFAGLNKSLGTAATGSFDISTSVQGGNAISDIKINGVTIIGGTVTAASGETQVSMATKVAAAINAFASTPDYAAGASGIKVTISTTTPTDTVNSQTIAVTTSGFSVGNFVPMAGGANPFASSLSNLTIAGVSALAAPVAMTTTKEQFALDVVTQINAKTGDTGYTARYDIDSSLIVLKATSVGVEPNGREVAITASSEVTLSPVKPAFMGGAGGALYQPGSFVRTIGAKEYSLSGPNLYFSGINTPTLWSNTTGSGFIDMSAETSGAEDLTALARYQNYVAVLAQNSILILYADPDPTLNRISQVLNNTGTLFAQSVTQFGDQDVFYLSRTGLRSLRARDASNAASTTDIGNPIDGLVVAKSKELQKAGRTDRVFGLIEPNEGRFMLIMDDQAFIFSFFAGSKVSAWSDYLLVDSTGASFHAEKALSFDRKVFVRSGDAIFVYGGLDPDDVVYDSASAVMQTPFLDGDKPTQPKLFTGFDAAIEGVWKVEVATDPTRPDEFSDVGIFDRTTYSLQRVPLSVRGTHISIRMTSLKPGPARVSSIVITHDLDDDAG